MEMTVWTFRIQGRKVASWTTPCVGWQFFYMVDLSAKECWSTEITLTQTRIGRLANGS